MNKKKQKKPKEPNPIKVNEAVRQKFLGMREDMQNYMSAVQEALGVPSHWVYDVKDNVFRSKVPDNG